MKLPNKISLTRIFMIPIFVLVFFLNDVLPFAYGIAAIIFALAAFTDFIDGYIKSNPSAEVDYIHGEDSVKSLITDTSIGFIFSGMSKSELFKTVIYDGALPRKTFSMGHAEDKRYYLECRKITK